MSVQKAPAAIEGRVYIALVTDDRHFENKPSDPSTPSIDGDVTKLSADQKDQMIGRQRGGFGKAMGDIGLADGDAVTKRVRLLVEQGLSRKGYQVVSDPKAAYIISVSIDQFWAWMTPGFIALTFEAKIQCTLSATTPAGTETVVVKGYGRNYGQVAKDANWQEAYDPAFEDFIVNVGVETNRLGLRSDTSRTGRSGASLETQADLNTELRKLNELRRDGLLTEIEFETQKNKLLDR